MYVKAGLNETVRSIVRSVLDKKAKIVSYRGLFLVFFAKKQVSVQIVIKL